MLFLGINNFLYHCPCLWHKSEFIGKSYLLIEQQHTTPEAKLLETETDKQGQNPYSVYRISCVELC